MKYFALLLILIGIIACQKHEKTYTHEIIPGATEAPEEELSDDYVLVEFAAKLEEDYFRFKQINSP